MSAPLHNSIAGDLVLCSIDGVPVFGTMELSGAQSDAGHWVTIDGTHVLIRGGKIVEGPAALRGKTATVHPVSGQKGGHAPAGGVVHSSNGQPYKGGQHLPSTGEHAKPPHPLFSGKAEPAQHQNRLFGQDEGAKAAARAAGKSGEKRDLFGNHLPVQKHEGLFGEGTLKPAEKPAEETAHDDGKVKASASAVDPRHTAPLPFGEKKDESSIIDRSEPTIAKAPASSIPPKAKMGELTGDLKRIRNLRTGGLTLAEAKAHLAKEKDAGKELTPPKGTAPAPTQVAAPATATDAGAAAAARAAGTYGPVAGDDLAKRVAEHTDLIRKHVGFNDAHGTKEPHEMTKAEVGARLDTILGVNGGKSLIDKAVEARNAAGHSADSLMHVHELTDGTGYGLFDHPQTTRSDQSNLVSRHATEEEAYKASSARAKAYYEPHRAKVQSLFNEADTLKHADGDAHEQYVADAMKAGKAVPAHVLAEYPNLSKPAAPTQPPAPSLGNLPSEKPSRDQIDAAIARHRAAGKDTTQAVAAAHRELGIGRQPAPKAEKVAPSRPVTTTPPEPPATPKRSAAAEQAARVVAKRKGENAPLPPTEPPKATEPPATPSDAGKAAAERASGVASDRIAYKARVRHNATGATGTMVQALGGDVGTKYTVEWDSHMTPGEQGLRGKTARREFQASPEYAGPGHSYHTRDQLTPIDEGAEAASRAARLHAEAEKQRQVATKSATPEYHEVVAKSLDERAKAAHPTPIPLHEVPAELKTDRPLGTLTTKEMAARGQARLQAIRHRQNGNEAAARRVEEQHGLTRSPSAQATRAEETNAAAAEHKPVPYGSEETGKIDFDREFGSSATKSTTTPSDEGSRAAARAAGLNRTPPITRSTFPVSGPAGKAVVKQSGGHYVATTEAGEHLHTGTFESATQAAKEHVTRKVDTKSAPLPTAAKAVTAQDEGDDEAVAQKHDRVVHYQLSKRGVEHAQAFDRQGNQIFSKTGDVASVTHDLSADEARRLNGGIVTHGHPKGQSFSDADLTNAHRYGLHQIRIVHKDGAVESMTLGKTAVSHTEVADALAAEKNTPHDAERSGRIAKALGWQYTPTQSTPQNEGARAASAAAGKEEPAGAASGDVSAKAPHEMTHDEIRQQYGPRHEELQAKFRAQGKPGSATMTDDEFMDMSRIGGWLRNGPPKPPSAPSAKVSAPKPPEKVAPELTAGDVAGRKWSSYRDGILNQDVDALHMGDWDSVKARVFSQRVHDYPGGPKSLRHFPQINDDVQEHVHTVGDADRGYKTKTEAKQALLGAVREYESGLIKNAHAVPENKINEYPTHLKNAIRNARLTPPVR